MIRLVILWWRRRHCTHPNLQWIDGWLQPCLSCGATPDQIWSKD